MKETLTRFLSVKRDICAIIKRKTNVMRLKSGHIRGRFLHESVDRDIFIVNLRTDYEFRIIKRRHKHKPNLSWTGNESRQKAKDTRRHRS